MFSFHNTGLKYTYLMPPDKYTQSQILYFHPVFSNLQFSVFLFFCNHYSFSHLNFKIELFLIFSLNSLHFFIFILLTFISFRTYRGKVKISRSSLRETRDKQLLGRDLGRNRCHCIGGHRRQHMGKLKSSRPTLQPT